MVDYTEGKGYQYHIHVKPGEVGKYVILPGDPGRCEEIASYFDDPKKIAENREYTTYTGYLEGVKVSVCSTGIGGPSAAIALEELVRSGADTFIRVGTCGGMRLDVLGGDIIIATGAVRMEGTSKEYAPIEFPAVPHFDIVSALKESAEAQEFSYHLGVVQCKDSFYGEHEAEDMPVGYELLSKWSAWIRLGCLGSEMESAALFVVASKLHVRIGTVLLALANQERERVGLPNIQEHDNTKSIKTAIEALRILIKKENISEQV